MKEDELRKIKSMISSCEKNEEYCSKKAKKYEAKDLIWFISCCGIFSASALTTCLIGPLGLLIFSLAIPPVLIEKHKKWGRRAFALRALEKDFRSIQTRLKACLTNNSENEALKLNNILDETKRRMARF